MAMTVEKAIEYLKERLKEIPYLATLPYDNDDHILWRNGIEDVLEEVFKRESTEYKRFIETRSKIDSNNRRASYLRILKKRETALLSIIHKYEILGSNKVDSYGKHCELPSAFISHGKESIALDKIETFVLALGVNPLIVKDQPSLDKTVDDKVEYYLSQADAVIILATGDDEVSGKHQPRQNVIHEIGLSQKTLPGRIIYLLEANAEFPSNIRPKVWESFSKDNMENVFERIVVELVAFGLLKVVKPSKPEE